MRKSNIVYYINQEDSVQQNVVPTIDANGVETQVVVTLQQNDNLIDVDVENSEKAFSFYSNLKYWNQSTSFMSTDNYKNDYFKAIVSMGEDAVPFIKKELTKKPSSLVHALDLIYPERVKFNGFVSLERACDVWLRVLK